MSEVILSKLSNCQPGDKCWQLIEQGATVIDVRSPQEFASGHLPHAINVPLDTLARWVECIDNSKQIFLLYCGAGIRAQKGCDILNASGLASVVNAGALKDLLACKPQR
ncbi:rhodanese-like domain-containing protein [Shewanella sp. KX20019]|uniref:rhodanese-like domain-containing protein n=1 Tax=Shewanella sp. KX20019 TaxID=2803864 RepID=UPI001925CD63|nr:rhodanese-like domain-containing protein [Shewanella sp. KX20019]QQX79897.1 rhodanese-like domain-containing protein [Shewanella sp. KX20019]